MAVKAQDLFKAYAENALPSDGGYIVSSFLDETSTYSKYEIVAYDNVKTVYLSKEGLTFQSDGNKLFILVEPATYPRKYIEPFRRDKEERIPHRFSEVDTLTTRDQAKVMVSKEPVMTYGSFTIMKPTGINYSFIFYARKDVLESMRLFFEKSINQETKIPKSDAKKAAGLIIQGLEKFGVFQ
jgi:hypothetical protein